MLGNLVAVTRWSQTRSVVDPSAVDSSSESDQVVVDDKSAAENPIFDFADDLFDEPRCLTRSNK